MIILSLLFLAYIVASIWYIRILHGRIKTHEDAWVQIEKLTDHNKDGDVVIHVQKR